MARRFHHRKTLLFAFFLLTPGFLFQCGSDDGQTITQGNGSMVTPDSAEVKTDTDTSTIYFNKDGQGTIQSVSDDLGNTSDVGYSGEYMIEIGSEYSAKVDANGNYTETLLDYGAYKSRADRSFSDGRLQVLAVYNLEQQTDGSFKEEMASRISDIQLGSQNQGTFLYESFVGGSLRATMDGTFSWIDMDNKFRSFGPYAMMLEFTDRFNSFINVGHDRCIDNLELTDRATGQKLSYGVEHTFDGDGNITDRTITIEQQPAFTNTVRHTFYF